jgi:ribulose bisphosphate carboxylase small subunit
VTNQIQNPVAQMFALAIEHLEGYKPRTNYTTMLRGFIEDGDDEETATLKVLDKKQNELDELMFMKSNSALRALGKPIQSKIDSYFKR